MPTVPAGNITQACVKCPAALLCLTNTVVFQRCNRCGYVYIYPASRAPYAFNRSDGLCLTKEQERRCPVPDVSRKKLVDIPWMCQACLDKKVNIKTDDLYAGFDEIPEERDE